jgi:hypothetical protein
LAGALDGLGRQDEALDRLTAACARFPDEEKLHSDLASALATTGLAWLSQELGPTR